MENPWLNRRVLAYAHQGGALEAPSSTLFAFDQALRVGATALEMDLHQSADGVVVVCHDPTLDRTTERSGEIARLSSAEIRAADASYWFVPQRGAIHDLSDTSYPYRGRARGDSEFRVTLLEDVLERYPSVLLNLDIKRGPPDVVAYEGAVAALLRTFSRADDVIVTSFDDEVTARFHTLAPEVHTAPGVNALTMIVQAIRRGEMMPEALYRGHVALQVPLRVGNAWLVDESLVARVHELGLALHVWTVDDPGEMTRLVQMGVDGVMSDVPRVLATVLERAAATYR